MGRKAAKGNRKLDMVRDGESGTFDKLQSYMGEAFHGQIL